MPTRPQRLVRWLAPQAPSQARQLRTRISGRRAYAQVAGVYVVSFGLAVWNAFALLNDPGLARNQGVPTPSGQLAEWALDWSVSVPGLLLTWHLLRRRGWTAARIGMRPAWATGPGRRREGFRVGAVMFLGLFVADLVLVALAPHSSFPHGKTGAWGEIGGLTTALQSGFTEELIVTAFVITTLRQARRPWPEIVVVSLGLRAAYHVYYDTWWILLWVTIWAGTAFALYARTRRLTPLIVAHFLWDAQGTTVIELGHGAAIVVGVVYLIAFSLGFVYLVTWALQTAIRRTQVEAGQTRPR